MTGLILGMAASYALLAALLGWLVVASRAHVLVKLAVVAAIAVAVPFTYHGVGELRGLPTDSPLPAHFIMHWARVVEPNPLTKDPGHVFLWLELLDAENYPSGTPRAYNLAYEEDLVRRVQAAMGQIADGETVAGTIDQQSQSPDTADALANEQKDAAESNRPDNSTIGDRGYAFDPSSLTFGVAPAPVTPEKPTN